MLTRDDVIRMAREADEWSVAEKVRLMGIGQAPDRKKLRDERLTAAAYAAGAADERKRLHPFEPAGADQPNTCRCGPDGCADSGCPGRAA
jgi:hypothetical protein